MSLNFEELDHAETRFGELVLRRRRVLSLDGAEVYEVKLNGEFLMSSLVNDSEIALSELGLAALGEPPGPATWDVVVGGLGLGYTAAAALGYAGVASVRVVEALPEVIAWHTGRLVPMGATLMDDPRCTLLMGDFFARARDGGFDPAEPERTYDAVLLDIDHSPAGLLDSSHQDLYTPDGLRRLAAQLRPGGVFALWSSEPPETSVTEVLGAVLAEPVAHAVEFDNPMLDREDVNTIYVARRA